MRIMYGHAGNSGRKYDSDARTAVRRRSGDSYERGFSNNDFIRDHDSCRICNRTLNCILGTALERIVKKI